MLRKPKSITGAFNDDSKAYLNTIDELYDSEINFSISVFWDMGFKVEIGDQVNGILDIQHFETIREAIAWLAVSAVKYFPQSEFAENYKAINGA